MRPLHVALVCWDAFTPGGIQSQVVGRLAHVGYPGGPVDYTLFTKRPPLRSSLPHVRTELFSGWDWLSIAVSEYTASRNLLRALDRIRRERPIDLVELHAGGAGPALSQWSRRTGVPYLFVCHSLRFFSLKEHGHRWEMVHYYAWATRRAVAGASKIIAVSDALKSELVRFGVPSANIAVHHTATTEWHPAPRTEGSRGRTLRIIFVGRASREKGLDLLIDAANQLHEQSLDFLLTIVGDIGPEHEQCLRSQRLSLPVRFVGPRANLEARQMIAESDILVVPSRYDSCPVVAIEALMCGTPVVATSVGGLPELIQHGDTGMLVPPSADALASAIMELARAPERLRAMRLASRGLRERFLWRSRVPEILETYRAALGEHFPGHRYRPAGSSPG
jgi:glycosyltransferase involved in cell wall biosynthesis